MIDTHAHLNAFKQKDLPYVFQRAQEAGITTIINVGTQPDDWALHFEYARTEVAKQWGIATPYTVGLHPGMVTASGAECQDIPAMLYSFFEGPNPKPIALGEIGLDFFRLPGQNAETATDAKKAEAQAIKTNQINIFKTQLAIAKEQDVPVVIHSRHAFEATFKAIDESGFPWEKIVFHCWSYGPENIQTLNARGARASFTGLVTYKNAPKVHAALAAQFEWNPHATFFETDAPYLAPEPHRGKRCAPAHVALTISAAAQQLGLSTAELTQRSTAAAKDFFAL